MSEPQEPKQLLITKIKRRPDGKGADLFAKGHRYADTTLFDLSDLTLVDIDFETLQVGVETPCRFWAIVEPGKVKPGSENGTPYLDVVTLKPFEARRPKHDISPDLSELLTAVREQTVELRAVRALLQVLVARTALADPFTITEEPEQELEAGTPPEPPPPDDDDLDTFFPRPEKQPAQEPGHEAPGGPPTSPKALLAVLVAEGIAYTSPGHVLFGIKKAAGSQTWAWPPADDPEGWAQADRLSRQYAASHLQPIGAG